MAQAIARWSPVQWTWVKPSGPGAKRGPFREASMDQNIRIVVIEVDRPVGKRDQFRLFFRSNQTPAKCVSYAITER
jgi:hypothetical protein